MSELEFKILAILQEKNNDEHIYLRSHNELEKYSPDEIASVSVKLMDEGYLNLYRTDELVEIDKSLVNYFYEITEAGYQAISLGA